MDDGLSPTLQATARPAWQTELAAAITRPAELLAALGIDPDHPSLDAARLRDFPIRVPRSFVARMRPGDVSDPLFLQVWPQPAEGLDVPGYGADAVGDLAKLKGGGLIHKYQGRALAIATGACAVNCRYCFRRHFPYGDALAARGQWRETLAQLDADQSIREVILSGGDPLALSDDKLAEFVEALDARPWIRRLRLHTRVPVVLPERVDENLLGWLNATRLQKVVVLHINHENEIDEAVDAERRRQGSLVDAGRGAKSGDLRGRERRDIVSFKAGNRCRRETRDLRRRHAANLLGRQRGDLCQRQRRDLCRGKRADLRDGQRTDLLRGQDRDRRGRQALHLRWRHIGHLEDREGADLRRGEAANGGRAQRLELRQIERGDLRRG